MVFQQNLFQTMLPSWLRRLKNGKKSSCNQASSKRTHREKPVLARSLSFQRADTRAKSARSEILADPLPSDNRFSKSVDALYVLSKLKDGVKHMDIIASQETRNRSDHIEDTEINKVSIAFIEERINQGLDLWDREFSSMSSYASDHDGAPHQMDRETNIEGPLLKSLSELEIPSAEGSICAKETKGTAVVTTKTSSCSAIDSTDPAVRYIRGCNGECEQGEMMETVSRETRRELIQLRRRRGHNSSSLSAVLPSDLNGVVGDSIALVKLSLNPYEDFRSSMYEMIMEKDLEESMDIEELLYCYISLNAPEHHNLIKEVFSEVWSEILMRIR